MAADEEPAPGPGAGALDRGLAMLGHLAEFGSSSTVELAQGLGLSRSTTYRLVERLREKGWLAADPASGRWRLGPAAARLASAAVGAVNLRDVSGPVLKELRDATQETVSLAVPNGVNMVFVQREKGPRPVAVSDELGVFRPMHCTSVGRAYLAGLPLDRLESTLDLLVASSLSPIDSASRFELMAEIVRTRQRGWSQDIREFDESSCCCGAAVFDHTGQPVAAISVAGVAERMEKVVGDIGPKVAAVAATLSEELGYNGAAH